VIGFVVLAVKGIVVWLVLMFVGKLLMEIIVGELVRLAIPERVHPEIARLYKQGQRRRDVFTVLSALLALGYLALLLRIWNLGVALATVLLMASRVPDFLVEIRTGQKMAAAGAAGHFATIAGWLALPVLWASL
jgi:hypothetical protein